MNKKLLKSCRAQSGKMYHDPVRSVQLFKPEIKLPTLPSAILHSSAFSTSCAARWHSVISETVCIMASNGGQGLNRRMFSYKYWTVKGHNELYVELHYGEADELRHRHRRRLFLGIQTQDRKHGWLAKFRGHFFAACVDSPQICL